MKRTLTLTMILMAMIFAIERRLAEQQGAI